MLGNSFLRVLSSTRNFFYVLFLNAHHTKLIVGLSEGGEARVRELLQWFKGSTQKLQEKVLELISRYKALKEHCSGFKSSVGGYALNMASIVGPMKLKLEKVTSADKICPFLCHKTGLLQSYQMI
jgi:hypothetical protein